MNDLESIHKDLDNLEHKAHAGEKPKKPSLRKRIQLLSWPKKIALISVVALLLGTTGYFTYDQYKYEGTDDAYVQAYSTQIAPKISGLVTHVLVVENQRVSAGQILVQIDRRDYEAALRDATELRDSLDAQYREADRDYERMKHLVQARAVSVQAFDRARANFLNLERQTKAAEARAEEARLNLEYSSVRAPTDGVIARRSIDVGMYASAGTAVLGFVPSDERWVDANFKETQISSIVPGRPARVTVDAIPGKAYAGVVESVSPATGATFTLLPPDNATGNFTKVVQRIPVRVRLKDLNAEDIALLQAGLSAEVDIYKQRALEAAPPPPTPIFAVDQIRSSPLPATERAGVVPSED